MIRRTAMFSGRVQGVGFRYTACRVAERFAVTGHAKNLSDGRVEVVAEGSDRDVEAFLAALRREMSENVDSVTCQDSLARGGLDGFTIRY